MKIFSLLYQGDVHPVGDEKIIPQEDYSALLEAAELVQKAQEDAKLYREETQKECEELKETAKKEGFEAGLVRFNEHILHLEAELKKLRHETHKLMLPLVLKAAKKIVAKELELHPDTIVDIVLQTLAPVTQSRKIIIYVNKADKELLEAQKPKLKQILEHVDMLSIQDRQDISAGGCIIETESGIINAGIENQWRALESAFDKYMKPRP